MEVSGLHQAPSLQLRDITQVYLEQQDGGPHSPFGRFVEEKNPTEIQTSDLPARSIICSPTALSRSLLCSNKSFVSYPQPPDLLWNLSGHAVNESFSEIRGTRRKAGHSPVHRAGGNNEWHYVSLLHYTFMMCKRTLICTQENYKDYH